AAGFAGEAGQIAAKPPQDPAERAQSLINRGVEFLKSKQQPDGGWAAGTQPIGITSLALRGLAASGTVNSQTDWVKKGYEKLLKAQLADGGIYKDTQANYNTAISVSALATANNPD